MNIENITILHDRRTNGMSVSVVTTIREYLEWFDQYGKNNKLEDQRPVLTSRSAGMIRKRLVKDLKEGAVIPSIVVGLSVEYDLDTLDETNVSDFININLPNATVIDGMQRTGALIQASMENAEIATNKIRLDFWISNNIFSLIYRMLVLNTGQTPWDIKRQMEVVYKPFIEETRRKVAGISIHTRNDATRRSQSGEYRANSIAELFLAFTSRKENINNNEKIADDFTKLDVTQMAGSQQGSELFYETMSMLYKFDMAISRFKEEGYEAEEGSTRFSNGMDLFTQTTASVGFVVAVAQEVLGKAGSSDRSEAEKRETMDRLKGWFDAMIAKIIAMNTEELTSFLSFDVLREKMNGLPAKNIGAQQKAFYRKAFAELIEDHFDVETLNIAWQAY